MFLYLNYRKGYPSVVYWGLFFCSPIRTIIITLIRSSGRAEILPPRTLGWTFCGIKWDSVQWNHYTEALKRGVEWNYLEESGIQYIVFGTTPSNK